VDSPSEHPQIHIPDYPDDGASNGLDSLTGKLKAIFPTLFYSLSSLEKELLDRSHLCLLLTDSHSPHACPTPGVYTFTVTQTIGCFTSLGLGFSNRPDRNSQSFVVATRPLPGELTSTTHSLTWREFLIGRTTCLCNQSSTQLHPGTGDNNKIQHLVSSRVTSVTGKRVWTPKR
jgi:hypothetical protein